MTRDPSIRIVAAACRMIERADTAPNLETLAEAAGLSRFHFHRLFRKLTGLTPKAYARAHRSSRVRTALQCRERVTDAVYEAGYQSSGRFYAEAGAVLGMQPRRFRARGRGEVIRFAVGQCSLGEILVAATGRGICAIMLGDDPEALVRELQEQFRHAELIAGDQDFDIHVARVIALVEAPRAGADLPLDIQGTAFQQRVWQALREIPPGRTASYAEIAGRIGAPGSARAVASACAANRLAVAIPCHRVVRRDGSLSGYRWGVERKRELLRRERD